MNFKLKAPFQPTGDQPSAIEELTKNVQSGADWQVLLGVTGSGKTFTLANVIEKTQKPTLVISHNKTLAAQLYQEFKDFFPDNAVSYFVSYYDYYQPEAYVPRTDTYIAKEADINKEIDKLRLQATSHILSRKDVIIVASVSCIYNIGSPEEYQKNVMDFSIGKVYPTENFMSALVAMHYQRARTDFDRGQFRVRGTAVEIAPAYSDEIIRVSWNGNEIVSITTRPFFGSKEIPLEQCFIYPAKHYLADENMIKNAFHQIREDLKAQVKKLEKEKKLLEANRLSQRVNYDLEMIKEVGYVNGIENYSRYFDGRLPGDPPYTLVDYFHHQYGNDFLTIIDESHMTIPQLGGMYNGDLSRKKTLVDFGFRLPACLDNRPLKFSELLPKLPQIICASATPEEFEIEKSRQQSAKAGSQGGQARGRIVEQLIRPTGLVDPEVEVRPTMGQIPDLIKEIIERKKKGQRVLVTTLTKRLAEELSNYISELPPTVVSEAPSLSRGEVEPEPTTVVSEAPSLSRGGVEPSISVNYLHADVETLERTDILADLRRGRYDVIVGINLLREGLDLPEVSLVAILDADQAGFLRSKTSLIQTMGRAARHLESRVILYADGITTAMREAMEEVGRRRAAQLRYNEGHGITPRSIEKPIRDRLVEKASDDKEIDEEGLTPGEAKMFVKKLNRQMREYAKLLDFEKAARIRDKVESLKIKFDLD